MKYAATCECDTPLIISEDDYCSICSRYVELPADLPEEPQLTPLEEAISMRRLGYSAKAIQEATGVTDKRMQKALDPIAHGDWRKRKTELEMKARANAKPRPDYLIGKTLTSHPDEFAVEALKLRDEGMSWNGISRHLGVDRDQLHCLCDDEFRVKFLAQRSAASKARRKARNEAKNAS